MQIYLICNYHQANTTNELDTYCAIDLFSKYVRVVPLKHKIGITIANIFEKIISKGCKTNKIWADHGGEK